MSCCSAPISPISTHVVHSRLQHADFSNPKAFWARQFDAGLSRVHFPVGLGGLGLAASWQKVVDEALEQAGAPNNRQINPIGFGFVANTLQAYGTEEQKRRY